LGRSLLSIVLCGMGMFRGAEDEENEEINMKKGT
jgi:hypothetical protein